MQREALATTQRSGKWREDGYKVQMHERSSDACLLLGVGKNLVPRLDFLGRPAGGVNAGELMAQPTVAYRRRGGVGTTTRSGLSFLSSNDRWKVGYVSFLIKRLDIDCVDFHVGLYILVGWHFSVSRGGR